MKKINYIDDIDKWQKEFTFSIPITPRFQETDMFGHVNNTAAFIYFEEARIQYLKKAGLFLELTDKTKPIPIVADLQCDYHKQIFFGDLLQLYVKLHYIGTTSFDIHYLVKNQDDQLCITGRGRMVQINPQSGKPTPFSEEMKKSLSKL
ncbi:acyl-CoA thioesterase [Aquibacillus rhizosphaerae]|uniref:Thioesterase family protein n=1 Tax=Aquibacillus rhizosphaerae TaxID=3051431 RepID=A0ABT7L412_9BACI|nr:thioesterase family protein [Aquibacillus sp. LR5S19]MDL4840611.1 thioesterase family protein [Aquibacillus sp. LR5S19]